MHIGKSGTYGRIPLMRAFPSAVLVLVRVLRKGEEERQLLRLLLPLRVLRVGVGVGVLRER